MATVRIESDTLDYYQSLERAVHALNYFLVDCRHSGWCDCKYQVRKMVAELAARIDAHKATDYLRIVSKEKEPTTGNANPGSWSSDFGKGPLLDSFQLPGPETP